MTPLGAAPLASPLAQGFSAAAARSAGERAWGCSWEEWGGSHTLAAQFWCTPAPLPTVVPFEEVWSRSYCRALETLVDVLGEFPHEAEHVFKPSCVPLRRCAGCCGDEDLECVAVETRPVAMQVGPGGSLWGWGGKQGGLGSLVMGRFPRKFDELGKTPSHSGGRGEMDRHGEGR
uniref:Platelet-derived growth factor (PDGF) family profile domain-containing protein n=1 Tax=Gopherus agassizii TaxID=38772 RepID=A0A452HJP1_9SAUR